MASQPLPPRMTVEEFLDFEQLAEERYEFDDGEVLQVEAASGAHDTIRNNIIGQMRMRFRLDAVKCRAYGSDVLVRVGPTQLMKPDVVIHCEPEIWEGEKRVLVNPSAIVEVLSPKTEAYDRGLKFQRYRSLESFLEYFLVAQDRIYVEHHTRVRPGVWQMQEHTDLVEIVTLECASIPIPLAEIYYDLDV